MNLALAQELGRVTSENNFQLQLKLFFASKNLVGNIFYIEYKISFDLLANLE